MNNYYSFNNAPKHVEQSDTSCQSPLPNGSLDQPVKPYLLPKAEASVSWVSGTWRDLLDGLLLFSNLLLPLPVWLTGSFDRRYLPIVLELIFVDAMVPAS